MGRRAGKLKVEFIENQKSRNLAFKSRNQCLIKKIQELCTLCDVKAFMVLFDPGHDAKPAAVWPPNDQAQVRELIEEFMGDGEKAPNPIGVFLQKKTELARAQIDRLKQRGGKMGDDADQEQFGAFDEKSQFGNSSTGLMMPRGPLNGDVDEQSQFVQAMIDEHQFGHDRTFPQQQLLYQLFDSSSPSMYKEEDTSMMMMPPRDPDPIRVADDASDYDYDQFGDNSFTGLMMDIVDDQYQFGPVMPLSPLVVDDSSFQQQLQYEMMMPGMMDDAEQSCCNSGFDGQEEVASCSRQTAVGDDEDTAVQDFYDRDNFIAQLCTTPMMTWQSTNYDDDLVYTRFQDKGPADYSKCIDFDDFWV